MIFLVAALAGGIAALSGFGIGSLLTPLFALRLDLSLAVAAVSIPHLLGTAARFAWLYKYVRRDVFLKFGIWSALGGLAGALLHNLSSSSLLLFIFAGLLIFAGSSALFGWSERWRCPLSLSWLAGLSSGIFGGLVGNQGGIRSAALLAFDLEKQQFVATATAIALLVDAARMPVYFVSYPGDLLNFGWQIITACAGTLAGTWLGQVVLARIPEAIFKRLVAAIILLLGIVMLAKAFAT